MIEASALVCRVRLSKALNPVVATNELQFSSTSRAQTERDLIYLIGMLILLFYTYWEERCRQRCQSNNLCNLIIHDCQKKKRAISTGNRMSVS